MRKTSCFTLAIALCLLFPVTAFLCGKERWPIKVCKDPNVKFLFKGAKISSGKLKAAKHTTIADLIDPDNPIGTGISHAEQFSRVTGTETNIWIIEATITDFKEEKGADGDNDYHIAIKDSEGNTMIAEIPSPSCLKRTPQPLRDMIKKARADFDAQFDVTGDFKTTNTKVRITGPAMFDKVHSTEPRGVAPNQIEIHPVIKIEFIT